MSLGELIPVSEHSAKGAHISGMEHYQREYRRSIEDPEGYWSDVMRQQLTLFAPYTSVMSGSFEKGDIA
jgi:acetyl-CoA synthetase